MRLHLGLFFLFCFVGGNTSAQRGIGVRFGGDFNYIFKADNFGLETGWWSTGAVGPYYQVYFDNGGFKVGVNAIYKGAAKGLPFIMQDFRKGGALGIAAIEMEFKAGPRWKMINPQIGYLLGYRFINEGFDQPGFANRINKIYFSLPFGCAFDFPTGYGMVGFGVFFELGVTNVQKSPIPLRKGEVFDGAKIRGINFEITTMFRAGKQKGLKTPPPKLFETPGDENRIPKD